MAFVHLTEEIARQRGEKDTMGSPDKHELGNLSGILAGALVGAGVGLLFAPQRGVQMRGLLRDYAARAKDELDDAVDRDAEAADNTVERGQDFVEERKESLRETSRQAKGFADAGRKAVNDIKDGLASQQH